MTDETLEISREKLFEILSKSFSSIVDEALALFESNDKILFTKKIETIIDDLNHDILEKSKREKPTVKSSERIEIDWS